MLSTTERTVTYRPTNVASLRRLSTMVRVPFTHMYASPIWLAVRLYLGWMWFNFGLQKLQAGWLTTDPIGQMLKLVADGTLKVPFDFYRPVAGFLVESGMTPMLAHSMPFLEMAVALSFVTGVLVVPAAIGATLLNINFILSGIGAVAFDGRFIALQVLLILAFRIVGAIGFEPIIKRVLQAALRMVRPAHKAKLSAKC